MKKIPAKLAVALLWLILWQGAHLLIGENLILPSPLSVAERLAELSKESSFWLSIGASLARILAGYAIGVVLGCLFACMTAFSKPLKAFFSPLLTVIRATPVASFIILVLFSFTTGAVPVFISFLMVFAILWENVEKGLLQTDQKLLEMGSVYDFSPGDKLRFIYAPSAFPYFVAGSSSALGLAWKSGIAAEVLCHPKFSIGRLLYNSKIYLEMEDLFAWTAVIILLSVALEGLLRLLLKKLEAKK